MFLRWILINIDLIAHAMTLTLQSLTMTFGTCWKRLPINPMGMHSLVIISFETDPHSGVGFSVEVVNHRTR